MSTKTYKEKLDEREYTYRMLDIARQTAIFNLLDKVLQETDFEDLEGKLQLKIMDVIHKANSLPIRIEV